MPVPRNLGVRRHPRMRFSDVVCADLLRIAWWDWPHGRIGAAMADFRTLGAEEFCRRHG